MRAQVNLRESRAQLLSMLRLPRWQETCGGGLTIKLARSAHSRRDGTNAGSAEGSTATRIHSKRRGRIEGLPFESY